MGLGYDSDVPDQPLNPPEPRCPDYWDYLEATADQYNDEQKERNHDQTKHDRLD